MSELGNSAAASPVATGNGWSVGRTADGFKVDITRADGSGSFATDVDAPATDAQREPAKDRLLDAATDDVEIDRIAEAFAAPWVQG